MRGFPTIAAIIAAGLLAMGGAPAFSDEPAPLPAEAVQPEPEPVSVTPLENGSKLSDLSGTANSGYYFQFYIPAGIERLTVATGDGDGDVDLYLAHEYVPDTERFQYVSNAEGTKDRIIVENPQPGTWYVLLYGYLKFDDVEMEASWGKTAAAYVQPVYVPDTVNYVHWGYGAGEVVWPVIIRPRPFLVTGLFYRHRPFFYRRHHGHRPIIIHRGPPVIHRALPPRDIARPRVGIARPGLPRRVSPPAHVFDRGRVRTPGRRTPTPGRTAPRQTPGQAIPSRPVPRLRNPAVIRPGSPSARPRTPNLRTPAAIRPSLPASRGASPGAGRSFARPRMPRSGAAVRPGRGARSRSGLRGVRGSRGGARGRAFRSSRR